MRKTANKTIAASVEADVVTAEIITAAKPIKAKKAAAKKPAKAAKAKPAKEPKPAAEPKPLSSARAQRTADAEAGVLPAVPDFSAATHARFRKKHAEIVALVEAGNVKALKAYAINPISSSPKALAKYRDLAVTALEAQKAAAKKAAKADAA